MTKASRPDTGTPSIACSYLPPLKGQTMDTLQESPDISADPQAATPYFRRARADAEVRAEAARRGLPPDPLAA